MTDSIFCACGAQWHGVYARHNPVIAGHRDGAAHHERCRIISHEEFLQLAVRPCYCDDCMAARQQAWHAKRGH